MISATSFATRSTYKELNGVSGPSDMEVKVAAATEQMESELARDIDGQAGRPK